MKKVGHKPHEIGFLLSKGRGGATIENFYEIDK